MQLTEKEFKNAEKNNCKWIKYHDVPDMAFDHNEIIDYAKERLKRRVKRRPVGFNSLPKEFTLNQLQTLYEQALNKTFDKRNFRKKIFNSQLLVDTGKTIITSQGKESKLYKFDMERYEKMSLKGYDFLF
jgi:8-oxo-dGTP diphosphatase